MMARSLATLTACLIITACANWVKLEPDADKVRLVSDSEVHSCERKGRTTTSVRNRVAGVERNPGKVEQELADLARNSALELGGDTIVADGPVEDGERRFIVYRCRR
ncbi:MAG: DUF4156 domain-containing protein [Wenzhouxiangella sp.]